MNNAKKLLLVILLLALLGTFIVPTVYAHPGRTNGKGGHTDHSTGEYHYHHGYSAHGHYDIDGDGVVDCPYDFDVKTDQSSNESATVKPKTSTNVSTTEPTTISTEATSSANDSKSNTDFIAVLGWIIAIGIYVLIMFVVPFLMS